MEQEQRKKNFFAFDKNEKSILICTDVASRGLDFKKVAWIVQWDLSSNIKEYVNRVGRTARIAAEGSALSFLMPDEIEYVKYL
jgi:superfamily II DNA/RNA helicase